MKELKDGIRSLVRIDFHGHVHKQFRGTDADKRFANEVNVLKVLEERQCPNVPRLLEAQEDSLTIVTTNCGAPAPLLTKDKALALFRELEEVYGVRHDDPEPRNVTYSPTLGCFCLIDFELSEVLPQPDSVESSKSSSTWRSRWAAKCVQGDSHTTNDDAMVVLKVNEKEAIFLKSTGEEFLDPCHLVFAVADGMGGRNAGDFAARLVLNFIKKDASELYEVIQSGSGGKKALEILTKTIHDGLLSLSKSDPMLNGCGSTLTLAWVLPGCMFWVHVGDSRLYLKDGGHIVQLTEDDCRMWHRLKKGDVSEYAYRTDPRKSRLSDVIGGGHHRIQPQTGCIEIEPGARILLCTDGIMDGLWDRQIEERFDADTAVGPILDEMLERACENDSKDDTTLIVAVFDVV